MKRNKNILMTGLLLSVSNRLFAQTVSESVESLHLVLSGLYEEMIPLAGHLLTVSRALAGFAALWYIAYRVWGHIARSEPVDVYPLFRPFAIGLAITFFPQVLGLINGVISPITSATAQMVEGSNLAIARHIEEMESGGYAENMNPMDGLGGRQFPETVEETGIFERMANEVFAFNLKAILNKLISGFLQILFFAAALCINTIRTFQLVVLSILGPIVFGLSVFDGFHHTLAAWFARYINVSMWLPVANIFGAIISKIQLNMLVLDGDFASSIGYMVFMVIAIVGYITVPNVASFIVQPGGRDSLLNQTTKGGAAAVTKLSKF